MKIIEDSFEGSSMTYFVIGIEPFKIAEVWGVFENREKAEQQADFLEQKKHPLCCQKYVCMEEREAREKFTLYT